MTEDRTMTHFEEFENALVASAESLFATLQQPAISWKPCPRPRPSHEDTVLASLGFAGDHFRGNVIIASTLAAAKPLCPPILGELDDATVCDMFGEVGNMLLGRLKNEILHLGVTLHIGLPTTALVPPGRLAPPRDGASWNVFHLPGGPVFIRLAATFEMAFEIKRDDDEKTAPIGVEGDLFFF